MFDRSFFEFKKKTNKKQNQQKENERKQNEKARNVKWLIAHWKIAESEVRRRRVCCDFCSEWAPTCSSKCAVLTAAMIITRCSVRRFHAVIAGSCYYHGFLVESYHTRLSNPRFNLNAWSEFVN